MYVCIYMNTFTSRGKKSLLENKQKQTPIISKLSSKVLRFAIY